MLSTLSSSMRSTWLCSAGLNSGRPGFRKSRSGHPIVSAFESYAKEYDAIVEISLAEKSVSFALEYERTQKRVDDYLKICEVFEHERNLSLFLYLMPSHDLLARVARYFSGSKRHILFCLVREFKDRLLEASVSDTRNIRPFPLRQALSQT